MKILPVMYGVSTRSGWGQYQQVVGGSVTIAERVVEEMTNIVLIHVETGSRLSHSHVRQKKRVTFSFFNDECDPNIKVSLTLLLEPASK